MGILKILGIVFIILIAILIIGGFLVYNFVSLKIASACVSSDSMKTNLSCSSDQDCVQFFYANAGNATNLPAPLKANVDIILNDAAICSKGFCEFKNVSIIKNQGFVKDKFQRDIPLVDSCNGKTYDISMKVKDILSVLRTLN